MTKFTHLKDIAIRQTNESFCFLFSPVRHVIKIGNIKFSSLIRSLFYFTMYHADIKLKSNYILHFRMVRTNINYVLSITVF